MHINIIAVSTIRFKSKLLYLECLCEYKWRLKNEILEKPVIKNAHSSECL